MKLRWVGVVILAIAIVYGALWFELADRLESGFSAALDDLASAGITARSGQVTRSGFPHRVSILAESVEIAASGARPPLGARAAELALTLYPWRVDRLLGRAQQLAVARGGYRLVAPRADMIADRNGRDRRIALTVEAGSLLEAGADAPLLRLGALRLAITLARENPPAEDGLREPARARISLQADDVRRPQGGEDGAMERFGLEAILHGRVKAPWGVTALAQWRDAGGTLDIDELTMTWEDARLRAQGSVSLDAALRPIGALTLSIDNPARLVDRLRTAGVLDAALAMQLRPLLAGLPSAAGGAGDLTLPVSLQDGQVFLAGFPIARF